MQPKMQLNPNKEKL